LRGREDRKALLKALVDGHIQVITSNHMPWDTEAKDLEFPNAEFGAIGLETTFALLRTHLKEQLSLSRLVEALAIAPRELLGLAAPRVEEGEEANLTIFDPEVAWMYEATVSRSHNTPFLGSSLKGKAVAVINRKQLVRV
jgi:dihydroorotase